MVTAPGVSECTQIVSTVSAMAVPSMVENSRPCAKASAWSAAKPAKYKDNPNVVEVVAKIDKTTRAGAKRQVEIGWINNRQTKQVALERLSIDGQPQSLVSGALGLLLMQLE